RTPSAAPGHAANCQWGHAFGRSRSAPTQCTIGWREDRLLTVGRDTRGEALKMILARIALPAVLILAFASTSGLAQQKFPAGPVRIIAPYVPGGAVDIVARPLADL